MLGKTLAAEAKACVTMLASESSVRRTAECRFSTQNSQMIGSLPQDFLRMPIRLVVDLAVKRITSSLSFSAYREDIANPKNTHERPQDFTECARAVRRDMLAPFKFGQIRSLYGSATC
jgi:hypothetical protein